MLKIALSLMFGVLLFAFSSASTNAQIPRIKFKRGTHSATITGTVLGRSQKSYVVGAKVGQVLNAIVSSDGNAVRFVSGMGQGILEYNERTTAGDNYVFLKNNSTKTIKFKLTVSIQ